VTHKPATGGRPRFAAKAVVALTVLAIAVGIWARFSNVTHKTYYQDEAITSVRTAGYLLADVIAVFDGRTRTFGDLQRLMRPAPDRGISATVASLATEDPQHPPVFYTLQSVWMRTVGFDPVRMRILPVLLSLLALPLGFFCARELFASRTGALVMTALLAVSPFHVLYSYQTREYGLLTVAILAASLALLRALRVGTSLRAWVLYALAVTLGLYTYLLFAYVVVAHVAYVALLERLRLSPVARRFAVAAAAGVFLAVPWFAIAYAHRATMSIDLNWAQTSYPLAFTISKWAFFTSATFFDLTYASVRFAPLALAVVLFTLYAVARTARDAPPRIALFVLALTATTAVLLVAQDLALHERFSTIARYLTPTWLGLEFAVAYLLGSALDGARTIRVRRAWLAAFAAFVALGGGADAVNSRAPSWWENSGNRPLPAMAAVLRTTPHALVVAQNDYAAILSLAFLIDGAMRLQGFMGARPPALDRAAGTPVYLVSPTDDLRERLAREQHLGASRVYDSRDDALAVRQFRSAVASTRKTAVGGWGEGSLWIVTPP
jgi:uncharacterized membrane protein